MKKHIKSPALLLEEKITELKEKTRFACVEDLDDLLESIDYFSKELSNYINQSPNTKQNTTPTTHHNNTTP